MPVRGAGGGLSIAERERCFAGKGVMSAARNEGGGYESPYTRCNQLNPLALDIIQSERTRAACTFPSMSETHARLSSLAASSA